MINMLTKRFRVVFHGNSIVLLMDDAKGITRTKLDCAEFDSLEELDQFIADNDLVSEEEYSG